MDYSDSATAQATTNESPQHLKTVVRAVLSAVVFGAIGAALGRWLGRRANDESSHVVESMMKWSMGGFWATLAAYSSLKASEQENAKVPDVKPSPLPKGKLVHVPEQHNEAPRVSVITNAVQHDGSVQQAEHSLGMQK